MKIAESSTRHETHWEKDVVSWLYGPKHQKKYKINLIWIDARLCVSSLHNVLNQIDLFISENDILSSWWVFDCAPETSNLTQSESIETTQQELSQIYFSLTAAAAEYNAKER